jgi:hypothetical protein
VTPDEAADRAEISDVWNRYFRAMDTWDFDSLDTVFTPAGWRIAERHFRQHRTEGRLLPFARVRRYSAPPWLSG